MVVERISVPKRFGVAVGETGSTSTDVNASRAVVDAALGGVWIGGADGTLERFAP